MSAELMQLIYVSSAVREMHAEELLDLVEKSSANNQRKSITGLLLYQNGNFMQVLEGPTAAVLELQDVIAHDPRHRAIQTVVQSSITEREFPDSSMSLRRLDKLTPDESASVSDSLQQPLNAVLSPSRARKLLHAFRRITSR